MRGKAGLLLLLTAASLKLYAQAPSSLQYPTPNTFIANVSSVYMAPTVSGVVTSYSISPALPAGLSFNTATGIISGMPTAASAPATYTITATNADGSDNTSLNITVSSNFFNNSYGKVSFRDAKRSFKVGTTGQNAGDVALYDSVAVIDGQAIDCIVKTVAVSNVSSWSAYDQSAASGSGFSNNNDSFFSPQLSFSAAGYVTFNFQFILGGSYNSSTHTGTVVALQNVKLNTYDIDGNGGANSNQYNEFEGFTTSELGSAATISAPSYNASTGLTRFLSGTSANNTTVTDDKTRVRLTYDNMSSFTITIGANASGLAYYVLDFSAGPAFSTAVPATPPTIDLNTAAAGTGNGSSGCASALGFTASGQTNAAAGTSLNELRISYDNSLANLPDGANEELLINGFTAGTGTHALNFSSNSSSSVTLGGVAYTITKTVSGSTSTISFSNGSTFSLSNAEALLDALRYNNSKSSPSSGSRVFTVNIRNTAFVSPDAVFTATLNCVSISGNIYHDVNGLTDNLINGSAAGVTGTATGQFAAGASSSVYAVLTRASDDAVLDVVPVSAGGTYSFGRQDAGEYNIFIGNTATPGATVTTAACPSLSSQTLKVVGENLGAGTGTDGLNDGKLRITLGSLPVSDANFGIQLAPATSDYAFGDQANPCGFNYYTIPSAGFTGSDADGSVQSLEITSFPTNANYLKVGSTIYINGGTCPPQSICTSWPGTLTVPYGNADSIALDPAANGTTTVALSYRVIDNGSFASNGGTPSTITIPFIGPSSPITVSGNVWNDANGDGIKDAGEAYTNAASAGQMLYAMLIQKTSTYSGANTILASAAVAASESGYSFADVPSGNEYEVRIASLAAPPADGAAWSSITPVLAANYVGVSTNNNGTILAYQNTIDLVNTLGTVTSDKSDVNFGIEQKPAADPKIFTAPNSAFMPDNSITLGGKPSFSILASSAALSGSAPQSLSGSDAEDCATASSCTAGKKFVVNSIKANTLLYYYNGSSWTQLGDGQTISNFTLSNLRIHGQQGQGNTAGTALGFTYSLMDNADIASAPVAYSLQSSNAPLPVTLTRFEGMVNGCMARLSWTSASERNAQGYELEQGADGEAFHTVYATPAKNTAGENSYGAAVPMNGHAFFRLKLVDRDGSFAYSSVLRLTGACDKTERISLHPSPATQSIRLNGIGDDAQVKLFDMTGRLLLSWRNVSENEPLSVASLPAGNYIVEVMTAQGDVDRIRLLKQ